MDSLIELNADVGEGGPDALLLPYVDRVSIACGGHAGGMDSMMQALLLARELDIRPGAHPGYPDPVNFGRKEMDAKPADITRWIIGQTQNLMEVAASLSMTLFHVKPHGALYNRAAVDKGAAQALIAAVQELGNLQLIVLAGSPLAGWAKAAGLEVLEEAFADRRYLRNGQLAPRNLPGAVIELPDKAALQALTIARGEPIVTLEGDKLNLRAQTICLHGDGQGATERARAIALALANQN